MAMALRSLARKIMPVAATLRRQPPSRSLHHVELLRHVGGRCYRIEKNAGTDAELVKRVSESRNINRMLMIGGASLYCFLLFIAISIRNNAREEIRRLEEKYGY